MRLNPHSRLARFYLLSAKELPRDLCTYVWGLVGRLMLMSILLGSLLGIVVIALVKWRGTLATLEMIFIALLFFGLVSIPVAGVYYLVHSDNLLKAYLKAKKEKYCPLIQWKDD